VKDNAVQSTCFSLCAFGLGLYSIQLWRTGQNLTAICAGVVAVALFADVFLITLSKTGVLIALALAIRLLAYIDGWQFRAAVAIPLCLVAGFAVIFSSEAQRRVGEISTDLRALKAESSEIAKAESSATTTRAEALSSGKPTMSTASRLDFWNKSVEFIRQSPIIGHGAGSTKSLYASVEADRPSPYGEAVPDPHNQFLAIAIQAGLLGGALLVSMWIAHLLFFWGTSAPQVLGQAVVLQNVLGSLFNSQLSQVTQGTLYCLAVGLLLALLVRREQPRSRHP
jgi:O-antigen ligase